MEERPQIKAPGLKWRPRKNRWVPLWVPRADAVGAGYPSGTVNLEPLLDGTNIGLSLLQSKCQVLQDDMLLWLAGHRRARAEYDGTFASLFDVYETHPESPFKTLKPGSKHPYTVYLRRLRAHIGGRLIGKRTGLDVKEWYKVWSAADERGCPTKVAAGRMALTVLKSAVTFGCICGIEDCLKFREILGLLEFPAVRPRTITADAVAVVKAREAAHKNGSPSRALAYALQFETTLRQWDVTGQWYPIDYPLLSNVLGPAGKWAGLEWKHIGEDGFLRYTPSKTEDTSEVDATIDLNLCPMALEELQRVPPERRVGPVIVFERTKRPYTQQQFRDGWRKDRKAAGLPAKLWSRDLRASAITEGRAGGASIADAAKVAGHTKEATTAEVYDRARVEAHRRFATARMTARTKQGT